VLVDSPPGVSCPAVNAVMDSDVILLVTEPTHFGLYDFKLAVEAFRAMGKPMGAIVNRVGIGNDAVQKYCRSKNIPVLCEIPYDRGIAETYSRGEVITESSPEMRAAFLDLKRALVDLYDGHPAEAVHA
jgi:MinD superfamily P-loop ATPase